MSISVNPLSVIDNKFDNGRKLGREEESPVLPAAYDTYEGVTVDMERAPLMEPDVFSSRLEASISQWRKQLKKGVWIKLPIKKMNLVESAVKQGFVFHHAEPTYLMLVYWIPKVPCTLPPNASHQVGVGAVVVNDRRKILVVQENSGCLRGMGLWKIPTGIVCEGEDINAAVVREVKEETGIETEFVEILAFRQAHKVFFGKSDLFFICMLRPVSFEIQTEEVELEDAKWMPFEEYAAQQAEREDGLFKSITEVCVEKLCGKYDGFLPVPMKAVFCGRSNYFYRSGKNLNMVDYS
ncbi:hypothetical protein SAY87_021452 [Trapa incisa]|uniref:Nudix hydrolase domain-containing protein n=1 Tax=Trapa incisa TaxID=236973 RepID=A0AAN7JT06_9MYRT|nr:hypothetical protein SAY87_021452 [Trapa incisa]